MKLLLSIIVAIALTAVAGAIIMGNMTFEGTVTKHPYDKGLRWDKEQRDMADSGIKISLHKQEYNIGFNRIFFNLEGRQPSPSTINITRTRASTSKHDKDYLATNIGANINSTAMSVDIQLPEAGHWELIFKVKHNENTIDITKKIYAVKNIK